MRSVIALEMMRIQALDTSTILSLIPVDVLKEIKAKDGHPFFQAYSICHEGISNPRVIGDTAKPISWTRRAVQSIKNVITKGVKFFLGHNADNSTEGREVIGEVVADTQTEIDGRLHHVVISYHSPEMKERVKDMDICSQESEWNFFDNAGKLVADTIERLTGIALSNSKNDIPAFSGAKRLGMVQALEPVLDKDGEIKKGERNMTFAELKDEIKKMNVFPAQLYTVDEIKRDREFAVVFTGYDSAVKERDDKIKSYQDKEKDFEHRSLVLTAKQRLDGIIKDKNLTDKQKAFVDKSYKDTLPDISDDGLKKFVDGKLDDYKISAEIFGEPKPPEKSADKSTTDDKDDYTKASNNEFLNEDFNILR